MTRNPLRLIALVLIAGFLIFYTAQKYLAAAPAVFSPAYTLSTAIIVLLTALLPLAAAWLISKTMPGRALSLGAAAILPVILAALGLTLYWAVYLKPSFGVPLELVLPRALFPGVSLGVLLVALRLSAPAGRTDAGLTQGRTV
jgi:ABC-type sugar transport system permease subunit